MYSKTGQSPHSLPVREPMETGSLASASSLVGSKGTTPLASRVTSVLSTSHSDTEFRNALALLDARDIVNDAETRRQIRMNLQKEVIDGNGEIIGEFGKVAEQLHRIRNTLDSLNVGYQQVKAQIVSAHVETGSALEENRSLLEKRNQVQNKQRVLEAFSDHFVLSEDELAALTTTAEPVDDRFFDALSKSKRISKDCEVLLGFEKQTLGLELMENASKNINLGFQKLYKWIQREFKTLNLENPQLNAAIRRALRVLAERPSLFQNCLDFFAEARERILSDSFHAALTGSGSDARLAKPIDLTAHDPLRYIGDMLAWIHSATVSEREALEVLFVAEGEELAKGLKSGRDAEIWRLVADADEEEANDFNALKALKDLVDRNISGATRVLRQRVEQVIQSNEDIVPAYKIANLVGFYMVTYEKLLSRGSNLVESMMSLQNEAMRQFRALVREHIATIQGEFQQTPLNLGPPGFLQDCLKQLNAFMQTYDSSLAEPETRESGFESILTETFDPFMRGCENMARSMAPLHSSVFLVNCYLAAAHTLDDFDFTKSRLNRVRDQMEDESTQLIAAQRDWFRESSGLGTLIRAVQDKGAESPGVQDSSELQQASHQLDNFLPSAWMDAIERLKHLQDSTLARQITEDAAEQFCTDFEVLEEAVEAADGDNEGEDEEPGKLRTAFPRTTAEIRVLLS